MASMSGAIYYKTKYGATEDYARWLAEDTGFELRDIKKGPKVGSEDIVVIGSSLMMGKVTAAGWIKKNWDRMKGRKVVLFTVGGTKTGSKEREDIVTKSLSAEVLEGMKVFHLPGRIDHGKLNFLMSGLIRRMAKYEKDEEERRRALEGYDDVDRTFIGPIVDYIKGSD